MKIKPFFCLFLVSTLPMIACGLFQPGFTATQTAIVSTTMAASWTATPTLTPTETLTPIPTVTPDPCAAENLADSVGIVTELQSRFDDLSGKAANVERAQLSIKISELQELLQEALDQDTPPCLETLRDHQVKHMNFVIDTLTAFMQGADEKTVNEGIKNARDEHDEFLRERDRLLKSQ